MKKKLICLALVLAMCLSLVACGSPTGTVAEIVCHSCCEEVSSESTFCPHCGAGLKAMCSACNQELPADSKFCPHCGTAVTQEAPPNQENPVPPTEEPEPSVKIETPDKALSAALEGGYDGSEVTITFYHTMGPNLSAVLDSYIEEFNKLYPNIHIVHEQVGGYDDVRDQIKNDLTVGNQPNIAYCYPDHVALYNIARAVVTLDDLIASKAVIKRADGSKEILGLTDEQIAAFIEGYYNEGKQFGDGLMYTMPMSKSTEVLYYNKTFFDANGLSVPKTWDEMEALCAKILTIDPYCIPLGYDSEANWFITMTEQYGNPYTTASGDNHFLFDNDGNKAFVKEFREWYQKGYVTTQEIYGAYTSGLFVAQAGTNSYMSIGSSASATFWRPAKVNGGYPFEVGIATIPQVNVENPKVISQGPSLCIFKDANPQEVIASWLFVKFLTTNVNFQAEFSMASGYIPVLKSVAKNPVYASFLNMADGGDYISALSAKVCLEQESAYYTTPAFNGSSAARDSVGLLMQSAFTSTDNGNVDAMLDKIFADAVKECKR